MTIETQMPKSTKERRRPKPGTAVDFFSPSESSPAGSNLPIHARIGRQDAETLHTLQRLSREMTASLNTNEVYEAILRGVSELMDCDAFFIALVDHKAEVLNFVFRVNQGIITPPISLPLGDNAIDFVVRTRQAIHVTDVSLEKRFSFNESGGWSEAKSLICVPMILADRVIGVLSAQSFRREAYDETQIDLLTIFAAQAAIAIQNAQYFAETQRKMKQLSVLNEVARIVSSTIEIDQLLDLIYDQVRRVLPTDTYFVSLTDMERRIQTIAITVDDGERFPPHEIPFGGGLVSLVVSRRAPLLVQRLSQERQRLGVEVIQLGKPRPSESWLGVPMMTAEHFVGVLAVASYEPAAFDEGDQILLQNIASQAAIAIDNARHHSLVEDQARRDSLTQVFNHGYLITCLQRELEAANRSKSNLAIIMLDIDYFKEYNDRYGHLAGDAILRSTVQAVLNNVKKTDSVGRWGGEEFVIVLPGADTRLARGVAERIRKTLARAKIVDDQGRQVPVPTVSQGIAAFPQQADQAFGLVDAADTNLYRAKSQGRDQIGMPE
jgi:diguanylate cyclase (GGDEF)-like protein